jgi:hypothetical protein
MNRAVLLCIVFSVLLTGVPQSGQAPRSILHVRQRWLTATDRREKPGWAPGIRNNRAASSTDHRTSGRRVTLQIEAIVTPEFE